MNNIKFILLIVLGLNIPQALSLTLDTDEKRVIAIAWDLPRISQQTTRIKGRYLTDADNCFQKYRKLLRQKDLREFASTEAAEQAGYFRKLIGWVEKKKYADVCSPLYDYIWTSESKCKIIFFESKKEAEAKGYFPIVGSKR